LLVWFNLNLTMKLTPIKREGVSNMGLTSVVVSLKNLTSGATFESKFLVDTGAIDSVAPSSELTKIGIEAIGKESYVLTDGTTMEFEYGLAAITIMNKTTAGRVIFGPEGVEPILGVTALESVGMVVDPGSLTLRSIPAIYLK
jgi:clan AA aspartic protease